MRPEVLAEVRKRDDERETWKLRWPNHCRTCEGQGGTYDPGSFDHRTGEADPPSSEPCRSCTEIGLCARCGFAHEEQSTFLLDGDPCLNCGWAWRAGTDDACPEALDGWEIEPDFQDVDPFQEDAAESPDQSYPVCFLCKRRVPATEPLCAECGSQAQQRGSLP